ncbi:non-ribosomal peptide synthetase [Caldalkalibacillus mannanilyticus]|uniref:non-ribosomal peptide synthetase n=1 Tax=Caldalkalibacillus mannanilyticus TaxID=1418 RepID=UPI000687C894|nr:amino acid adenylation domain-containing protein [Caldalkalibacillus mannanilyticus]
MFDRKNVENIYNLSPMQEGILFHSIKDQESHVYFQQASVRIDTNLNQEILNRSFQQLIQKYSILRTLFIYQKVERPLQIVLKERKTNIFFEDISHLSAEEQQEYIKSYQENDKKQGFDLTRDLLFRLAVIQKNKDSFLLIWSFHHILMDGWCIGILIDDFFQFYKQNCSKKDGLAIQEKEKYPYVTYIKWLEKQKKEAAIAYWQEYLKGYAEEASLPKKITSSTETEYIQKNRFMELSPEKTKELQRIAQKYGVTLNILIQSVWGVLLQKYNLKEDVVFGSVVSGRPSQIEGIESMIGLFINTVPVRVRSKANMIFSELMREVQNGFLSSEPYQYLSLTEIQNQSVVKQKLFDHIIVFENFPIGSGQQSAEAQEETFTFKEVEVFEQTNYDFNFVVFPGEELKIEWSYNAAVYDEEWVSRMSEQWRNLLDQILDQPEIEIGELVLATQEECSKLEMWNRTEKAELANTTIHEWVEKQALQAPSEVAAFFDGSIMTYQELHEKSNQVAWRLRKEGVRPQEAIGLMVEPSFQMLIGMLGILKAGGAYVPLDPRLPEQRIWFMLEDTKARFVLSQTPLLSSFKECDQQIRWIDLQDSSLYTGEAISIPNVNSSHDLAYIMYTSGSTGQPKGVMVEHRNIVNLSSWFADIYDLSRHKNILQMTNLSFDVSVEETLVPLMHGAKVIIPTREVLWNSEDFGTFLREQEIQIAQFVPATLKNLLLKTEKIDSLQVVICGGEALDINTAKRVAAMGYSLYNHYGPTETTVDVLTYPYQESATPVYIGKPIYNVQAYILDHHHKQVGIGVPGELWISGAGVSRGYVNHEERTAESFIPAPLGKGNMYRTGDLACIHLTEILNTLVESISRSK